MPHIKAFQGYYYNQELVGNLDKVVAPPYDIISSAQREKLYLRSPFNIIRVILGKEHTGDNQISNKYSRAAEYFQNWIKKGILKKDEVPSLYLLKQTFIYNSKSYSRMGLVALMELVDFEEKRVFPHEETLNAPKLDRLKLLEKLRAHFSPIFSFYIDEKQEIENIFEELAKQPPLLKMINFDGVKNTLWRIASKSHISKISHILKDKYIFIADGHHRYETALNYRRLHPGATKNNGANFILMYFSNIEQEGLLVLPVYRLIKEIDIVNLQKFRERIEEFFNIQKMPDLNTILKTIETLDNFHRFGVFLNGEFFVLALKSDQETKKILEASLGKNKSDSYKKLDVAVLDEFLIRRILAIDEEKNINFIKDAKEAVNLVEKGQYKIAFFTKPTRLSQIKDVALSGERMPKKSTYFYPKLLSGLIINRF
jgi:uncharacterized protein (DUF1015 family)